MPYHTPHLREKISYITPDGVEYVLHAPPNRAVTALDGLNLPAQDIRTIGGPYQHGERAVSALLKPRTVQLTFRHNGFSRSDYWSRRYTLSDMLRINRTSDLALYSAVNNPEPGRLRFIYYQDGTRKVRDLDVYMAQAIVLPSPTDWDHFSIHETLQFIAYNPVFYDPTPVTTVLSSGNNNITYGGNWEEYPTLIVDGDATDFAILNVETGYYMYLDYSIIVGETVTFDLTYGIKTVSNNLGDNLIGYLTPSSNIINFCLRPHPAVPSGINTLNVSYAAGAPTITMIRYNRYVGI